MHRPPRDYQELAVNAVARVINSGYRQLYYALPTGCGKTRIMTMLINLYRHSGRVLVVAHRKELIEQTAASIRDDIPGVDVGIVMAEQNDILADVVVATWQSLTPLRTETILAQQPFSLILFDESHHAIANSAYERIMQQVQQHSPMVATVGCTATPFRSDKSSMQAVLPECAFMRSISDMQAAGWLAPLKWKAVKLSVAMPTSYSSIDGEKDYNQEQLYETIKPQTQEIVSKTSPFFGNRPAMVFAVNVAHAHELAAAYNLSGITSMALSANTPKVLRKDTLDAWKCGAIQCVVNVGLFTEGFDYTPMVPNSNGLGVVVIAAPTMSPSRYLQMIGRGTRLKPTDGDFKDCLVFDVAGNANLLETKQITLPKVLPTLQEDVFEARPDAEFVEFDGEQEAELEKEAKPKKPTLLRINDPLATSWVAWGHNQMNDIYYTGLTSDQDKKTGVRTTTYAVIIPSQRKDGLYLAYVLTERGTSWSSQPIVERAKPLNEIMYHVNHIVAANGLKVLLDKKAKWRKEPANVAQLRFLANLSPKYYAIAKDGGWNKGELAAILNWCKLMAQLKLLVQKVRNADVEKIQPQTQASRNAAD